MIEDMSPSFSVNVQFSMVTHLPSVPVVYEVFISIWNNGDVVALFEVKTESYILSNDPVAASMTKPNIG